MTFDLYIIFSIMYLMAKKQKFYVVWEGVKPGIYKTWAEANAQVFGHKTAKYKAFETQAEAEKAFKKRATHFSHRLGHLL